MTVLIIPLTNPYATPRYVPRRLLNSTAALSLSTSAHDGSSRARSMKSRRSAGSPGGSAWPFFVQPRSAAFTAGASPRSMTPATTGSAASSHTVHGGVVPPAPATDCEPAHVQRGMTSPAPSAAPDARNPRRVSLPAVFVIALPHQVGV